MRVKRFLANAQLLRQIIHGHAAESVAEKVRPRSINNSLAVWIVLSASRPRLGRPFHIASTLITMRKLSQYIWFPQSLVMSSEVENGAPREAATWTGRAKASRAGSE
jgi:hypothetical protein